MTSLLEVEHLRKAFGGVTAVDDVSLRVDTGQVHSIIGPNGAGKTTLFSLVSGLVQADSGAIRYDGRNISRYEPARRARLGIARTFQQVRLFPHLTVLENVLLSIERRQSFARSLWNRRRNLAESRRLLEHAGLLERQHDSPTNLSYGQQKGLDMIRALALNPRLLLLDEPAAGLSPSEIADVKAAVTAAREQGAAVLLIEHNVSIVMDISQWVTVMNLGRKIAEGPPEKVRHDPSALAAYLGRAVEDSEAAR